MNCYRSWAVDGEKSIHQCDRDSMHADQFGHVCFCGNKMSEAREQPGFRTGHE